jgi:hypothetical protein
VESCEEKWSDKASRRKNTTERKMKQNIRSSQRKKRRSWKRKENNLD